VEYSAPIAGITANNLAEASMRRIQALVLSCLIWGLVSCTAGQGGPQASTPGAGERPAAPPISQTAPAAGFSLPAPADFAQQLPPPRDTSYVPADLFREADMFEAGTPRQRVTAAAGNAIFAPDYSAAGPGSGGLAFAMYAFQLAGYGGDATRRSTWAGPSRRPATSSGWAWRISPATAGPGSSPRARPH